MPSMAGECQGLNSYIERLMGTYRKVFMCHIRIQCKGNLPCVKHDIADIDTYRIDQSTPIICLSSNPTANDQYHLLGLTDGRASDNSISYREVPASFNGETGNSFKTAFIVKNAKLRSSAGLEDMEETKSLRPISN